MARRDNNDKAEPFKAARQMTTRDGVPVGPPWSVLQATVHAAAGIYRRQRFGGVRLQEAVTGRTAAQNRQREQAAHRAIDKLIDDPLLSEAERGYLAPAAEQFRARLEALYDVGPRDAHRPTEVGAAQDELIALVEQMKAAGVSQARAIREIVAVLLQEYPPERPAWPYQIPPDDDAAAILAWQITQRIKDRRRRRRGVAKSVTR